MNRLHGEMSGKNRRLNRFRPALMGLVHALLAVTAYLLAFLVIFDFSLPTGARNLLLMTGPLIVAIRLPIFGWYHLFGGLWRYIGMRDILTILKAVTLSSLVLAAGISILLGSPFPRTLIALDWLLCLALVGGSRLVVRAFWEAGRSGRQGEVRAIVVGAGDAGDMLVREIGRNHALKYRIVGFVDDDPGKRGRRIHGIEVLGAINELPTLSQAHRVEELLIAIPSANGPEMRRITSACRDAKVEFKTVPSLAELMDAPLAISRVRRVHIDDLLRRDPVRIDHAGVERFVRGKRVLVTGAGGSIGSELCRQISRFGPERLVILDQAENSLFFLDLELRGKFPGVRLHPTIADVTDESRIRQLFGWEKPQVVFHAAAHKHVPLMEQNKGEAVKNNVQGTVVVVNAACDEGVEDFVLISTDKAVRPCSIMGATKRLAEVYVQALNSQGRTRFITVRFGNVLGSEGSVLQIFQRQIEAGGPVTITHPDMKRYFMTISEACQLVLQAATQGKGGEIFVLDMGDPINIVDLAKDLIALSGLDPERDIEIKFIGPRPGEKIFEELLNSETRIVPTPHEKILVVEADPTDYGTLWAGIRELVKYADAGEEAMLLRKLRALVPEYTPESLLLQAASREKERILVVDHDPYTRMTLKRVLESTYQVLEAQDRRQALSLARDFQPNVVILGYALPGVNIGRLCARLKTKNGCVSIIVLVESATEASLEAIRALGADDRLYKPIHVNILESKVMQLLEAQRLGG